MPLYDLTLRTDTSAGPKADLFSVAGVLVLCIVFAALRWCKLNSLVWGDPAMWLSQVGRAANGEMPYRDFAWNYPPLSIWFFSTFLRTFGLTFQAAQWAIDLLSLVLVLLSYWLLRFFLPRVLHLPVILLLVAIGATAQTKFTLFSLLTYSPSLQFATIGLLLLLLGALRSLRGLKPDWVNGLLLIAGAFIAETSKPESLVATLGLLALFATRGRRYRSPEFLLLAAACTLPGAGAYCWEAARVGLGNLAAGVSGYGLATFACPWWPTGLGVFGALASLAQAVLLAALVSLPLFRHFSQSYGKRYRFLLLAAVPCAALYLGYYWYLNQEVHAGWMQFALSLFWTNPVLLPVMWSAIVYWCYLGWRLLHIQTADFELFLALSLPVLMSIRSLFGTTLFPYTEVSAICYGLFILLGPVLLWRFLGTAGGSGLPPVLIVAALALLYSLMRVAGGYHLLLSNQEYTALETRAGRVLLHDPDGSAEIYRYVMAHTEPDAAVLDIPYGGGVNFAANRRSPAFSTEYQQLRPSLPYQQRDLDAVSALKPKIVLANEQPNYGTTYGVLGNMGCPCPRLVWQPDQPSDIPGYVFPMVRFIQENYRVERKIGMKLILVQNQPQQP